MTSGRRVSRGLGITRCLPSVWLCLERVGLLRGRASWGDLLIVVNTALKGGVGDPTTSSFLIFTSQPRKWTASFCSILQQPWYGRANCRLKPLNCEQTEASPAYMLVFITATANEDVLHRFIHGSQLVDHLGRTRRRGLAGGGVALLEEAWPWGGLRGFKPHARPRLTHSVLCLVSIRCELSATVPGPSCCYVPCSWTHPLMTFCICLIICF